MLQLPIISPQDALPLQTDATVVWIDARAGKTAHDAYLTAHVKGALHVALEHDLAAPTSNAAIGGRHPLPKPDVFATLLGGLGISPSTRVVVYDDKHGSNAAARFWWMLRSIGHQHVQVLDGGLQAAVLAGFSVESGLGLARPTSPYPNHGWQLGVANKAEVELACTNPNRVVIDVRDADRYNGFVEPIDLVAGHIPGAINFPFSGNLDADGRFLSPEQLRLPYQSIFNGIDPANSIVHCGSGVTACHTLLAIEHAGLPVPKLYVGSWSEWSRSML